MFALFAAACGDDDSRSLPVATISPAATKIAIPSATAITATATPEPPSPIATSTPVPFVVRSSVEQLLVSDAKPGMNLEVRNSRGQRLQTAEVDAQGTVIFRNLAPGADYVVASVDSANRIASPPVAVWSVDDVPANGFYTSQSLGAGFQYITTRDGTTLAVNVILPGPIESGPYPTVLEYSGYDVSNPGAPQVSSLVASVLGYAVVGVSMRGTACSGGSFDLFEPVQSTDGYDAVEIVAQQPWVAFNHVGMVGISYPGIAQLYVARTQPPHLAAIAPLSVVSDLARDVVSPGGVQNDGFPLAWLRERQQAAEPFGLPSATRRRDQGDTVCIENQRFRGQNPDQVGLLAPSLGFVPPVAERLAPDQFVDRIEVPVFLAGAWQDESLGAGFVDMLDDFTGTDRLHFTLTNGGHGEAVMPAIAARYVEFLSFYVRREIPALTPRVRQGIQLIGRLLFSTSNVAIEAERFADEPSFDAALAKFAAEPKLRILFENGAGGDEPGAAVPRFEHAFDEWPIPTTQPTIWYLSEGGRLTAEPVPGRDADAYREDPSLARITTLGEGGFTGIALPNWQWRQPADGAALGYVTDPLPESFVMVGTGSVDLWLRSTAADTDLQVTLSEVRPDGNEMYVQEGYLRASHRAVQSDESTILRPVHSQREADVAPLPADEFSLARVKILPFGHVFRAGSRIRIQVATPGGTRPLWTYDVLNADGQVANSIARTPEHPSRIVLPVIPDVEVPAGLPPCPSLRFQYCRPYQPTADTSATQ